MKRFPEWRSTPALEAAFAQIIGQSHPQPVEQLAGLTHAEPADPLPLKDATPVPAYPNPRPGSEL